MYQQFEPRPASLGLPPRTRIDEWLERLATAVNFLAFVEGKLVGHGVLCPEDGTGEVAVFVHQDYRGQGIGHRLLSTLVEEGKRLALRRLWGMTELDNVPMLALAHAVGFVPDADPGMFRMDFPSAAPSPSAAETKMRRR
jgi:acetyltransferase